MTSVSMAIRDRQPWILWVAIAMHLIWGISLIRDERVSALVVLVGLNRLTEIGMDHYMLGSILVGAALIAAATLLLERRISRFRTFLLLFPQYLLLIIAFLSDAEILIFGTENAVGQPVDRDVLLALVGPFMCIAALHTIAIYQRYLVRR